MKCDEIIYSTIKIETDTGEGTGFLIDFDNNEGHEALFIITNKHVIKNADSFKTFLTVRTNTKKTDVVPHWVYLNNHRVFSSDEYDLCAIYFQSDNDILRANGKTLLNSVLKISDICFQDDFENMSNTTSVLVVGYPNAFIDKPNNLPMARKGITSTPLFSSFDGKNEFVVDAGVWSGNSGSPVFVEISNICKLVGIIYKSKNAYPELVLLGCEKAEGIVEIPIGLGIAIKSYELLPLWEEAGKKIRR